MNWPLLLQFEMRHPRYLGTIAMCLCTPLLSGCVLNGAAIHSDLNYEQMASRIHEKLAVGSPAKDVSAALKNWGLDYLFENLPPAECNMAGPRGFEAMVERPGWRFVLAYTPYGHGQIKLWLDGESRLACVVYWPPRSKRDFGYGRPWRILP